MSSPQPPSPAQWQAPPPPPPRHQPSGPAPVPSTHAPHADAHSDQHEHNKLALLLALSIAIVSVLGAIVGWRAEVHASKADRFEQDAVAASITQAQLRSQAEAAAAKAYSNYAHYVRLGHEASELEPAGCNNLNPNVLADVDAAAVCSTRVQFSGYANDAYRSNGRFDVDSYVNDALAIEATRSETEPEVYQSRAESQRHHEDSMLYLSVFLVIALALLTLARIGKTTASRLVLAVPGWACLIGGAVFLGMSEL